MPDVLSTFSLCATIHRFGVFLRKRAEERRFRLADHKVISVPVSLRLFSVSPKWTVYIVDLFLLPLVSRVRIVDEDSSI